MNDRVVFENACKSNGFGAIDPDSFFPYPKNPVIAKFFKELGFADELGSGIRNLYLYYSYFSKKEPLFIEDDIFKTIIYLDITKRKKYSTYTDDNNKNVLIVAESYGETTGNTGYGYTEAEQKNTEAKRKNTEAKQKNTGAKRMDSTMNKKEKRIAEILEFCRTPRSIEEILKSIKLTNKEYFRKNILRELLNKGLLSMQIKDKPTSPKQKYYTTETK